MVREPVRMPIYVDAEWRTRMWATGGPAYSWRSEAQVRVVVTAPTPMRLVAVYRDGPALTVAKSTDRGVVLRVPLGEWLAGPTAPPRRGDPQLFRPAEPERGNAWAELGTSKPLDARTWSEFVVRSVDGATMSLFAIARQDTELRPGGHWRVRPDLLGFVPEELAALREARATWRRFTGG